VKAAVCPKHGVPDVVRIEEVPSPEVGAGQARVRVHAAALNFPDVLIVANEYQLKVPAPFVTGSEFAGVVEAVADGVTAVAPGDRVSGTVLVGAFAEEVAVDAGVLRRVPEGIDLRHAAAFGVAHSTAYHVLRSVARLQPGEDIVVLGAGGGVGLAAVQLGAVLGASVTAVASSAEKLAVAVSEGARHVVDHRSTDLRKALRELHSAGVDVVVDPVGGSLSEPALRSLRWGGRFVTVGYAAGEIPKIPLNLVLLKGASIHGFQFGQFAMHAREELRRNDEELRELLGSGRVAPHIGASFPLADVVSALRHVADGEAIGKVVIDLASPGG
jgi:NADPH2:quinone reductase